MMRDPRLLAVWLLMVVVSLFYIYLCPYTKVEESFNLQAMHDHIYHGFDISKFDHMEFPGVVPRTFIGSIITAYLSKPIYVTYQTLSGSNDKLAAQIIVRGVLALMVLSAYLHFLTAVKRLFGVNVAVWAVIITCTQFHFLFYSSRPLPNTFAAVFALLACSSWLLSRHWFFVFYSGWTLIVFRCELAILFGVMLIISLVFGGVPITDLIKWVLVTGIISLGCTVLVDSYFWGRWVWPEGEAFHFNAILNKSSEWGTSPFLWYFYSALPRAMGCSLLLVPLGMAVDRRCFIMAVPAFGFLVLYSLLPHKELRFIIYVVPILNVAAARVCAVIWNNRNKSWSRRVGAVIVLGHLTANVTMTALLANVSYYNYPGGEAIRFMNTHASQASDLNVHIDVYTAQTGVSRFLHQGSTWANWRYDKTEDPNDYGARLESFTHLLIGTPDEMQTKVKISIYSQTHYVMTTVDCFKNIEMAKVYPFIRVRVAPCVWLLERKPSPR